MSLMSYRGMGADNSVYQILEQQLAVYKDILIGLYRTKTKAIAERESLRFQYLTGMKSKLSGVISAIYARVFSDQNTDGEELVRAVIALIQQNIPMVSMNGGQLPEWAQNPHQSGGRLQPGYLSPITHLISEPYNEPSNPEQSPFYKIYGPSYLVNDAMTSTVIDYYFLPAHYMSIQGMDNNEGQVLNFSIPPSLAWAESYAKARMSHTYFPVEAAHQYLVNVLSTNYPAGNLSDLIEQARLLLSDIVEKTKNIIQLQFDIDQAENDLGILVSEYKDYLGSETFESILEQIRREAEMSEMLPRPEAVMEYSVTTTNIPVLEADITPIPVLEAQAKSKLPLIAAAVAALLLLKKGN